MSGRLAQLESRIQTRYCSETYVEREISKIKEENPEILSGFLPSDVIDHKPWNKKYLKELHGRFVCGARNEEAIRHMAKVSRFVYLKDMIITIAIAVAAIVGLICAAWALLKGK